MTQLTRATIVVVSLVATTAGQTPTTSPGTKTLQAEYDLLKLYYRQAAGKYSFTSEGKLQTKLQLQKPVLTWIGHDYQDAFNTVSPTSGEVYVWTLRGRVAIVGGMGSFPQADGRSVFHEFHLLTTDSIRSIPINMESSKRDWNPPGMMLKPIPVAVPPQNITSSRLGRSRRLGQMRKLSGEFSAATKQRSGKDAVIKKLASPLYRLDDAQLKKHNSHVVDGALFVFTGSVGTDPEMVLLIECHRTKRGLAWMYAPGRFTYLGIRLKHKGKLVWDVGEQHSGTEDSNFISEIVSRRLSLDAIREQVENTRTGSD